MFIRTLLAYSSPYFYAFDEAGGGDGGGSPETFTKEQVDALIVKERDAQKKLHDDMKAELAALQSRSSLTTKEREDQAKRLEELENQLLTKEQIAQKELKKRDQEYQQKLESASKERDTWRTRYEGDTIVRSLTDAAAKHNAFNPTQIVAILRNDTRISEVVRDGEPTGEFEIKVKIPTKDDKGKPIVLDLDPVEAVKHLSETDEFLNLFKSENQGGYGGRGSGKGGPVTAAELAKDPVAYRQARKEGKI